MRNLQSFEQFNESIKVADINEGVFHRLPKNIISDELYLTSKNLSNFYDRTAAGNDVDPGVIDTIIRGLDKVKKAVKRFNSKEEVIGTVYEAEINEAMSFDELKNKYIDNPYGIGAQLVVFKPGERGNANRLVFKHDDRYRRDNIESKLKDLGFPTKKMSKSTADKAFKYRYELTLFESEVNEGKSFEFTFNYNTDEDDVEYIQNILMNAGVDAIAEPGIDSEVMAVKAPNAVELRKAKKAIQADGFEVNESVVNEASAFMAKDVAKTVAYLTAEVGPEPGYIFFGHNKDIEDFDKLWRKRKYQEALDMLAKDREIEAQTFDDVKPWTKQN
jgi:hypothetical protein